MTLNVGDRPALRQATPSLKSSVIFNSDVRREAHPSSFRTRAGWTLFGLTKEDYGATHVSFMVLFLTVGVWHIVLNWRPIVGYLKDRSKKVRLFTPESSVALALTGVFVIGPLAGLFPFKQFLDVGDGVKEYWEATSGSPPWGHAEDNSLQRFCRGMEDFERLESQRLVRIDCDAALTALRAEGLAVEGLNQRLLDIAEENGTTPQALSVIIMGVAETLTPEEAAAAMIPQVEKVRFQRPYSGLGRMTLREEATRLGTDPEGIIEVLNGGEGEG